MDEAQELTTRLPAIGRIGGGLDRMQRQLKERVADEIQSLEARLVSKRRLQELLKQHPEFEEMLSLLS